MDLGREVSEPGSGSIAIGIGALLLGAAIFLSIQSDGLPLGLVGVLVGALIVVWGLRPAAMPRSRLVVAWLLFATFLTVQSLMATRVRYLSALHLAWWWLDVLVLFVAALWSHLANLGERLATWLFVTQMVLAAGAIVQAVARGERAEGWLGNPNGLGSALVWGLVVALALVLGGVRRWWSATALAVIGAALALTASLTSFAAALSPLALLVWWNRSHISRRQVTAAIAVLVLIATAGCVAWNLGGRASLLTSQHVGFSFDQRLEFNRIAFEMWRAKPLLGWGVGSFKITMPRYTRQSSEQPLYTHNTYSQMLAETGIAGALGFLILVVATGVTGWRFVARAPDPSTRALRQGFFAAWLTFTLAAGVDFGWFYLAGQIWWFVVSGLFIGASARAFARPPSAWIRMPLGFMVAGLIVCGSVLVLAANRFAVSGRRALEHGDLNQGVFQLEKAVRLTASPEDVQLLAEARRMRGGDRDLDRAVTELEASLRDNPDHYPLYHRLGLVQSGHADPQAVFASFERAYRLDPMFHPEYAHNYAVALFRSGAGAQAMAVIDRTLEMYGRGPSLDPEYAAEIDRLMALRDELERRGAHR